MGRNVDVGARASQYFATEPESVSHTRRGEGVPLAEPIVLTPLFQLSNGGVTQSNEPPKNPGRFISTGGKGG